MLSRKNKIFPISRTYLAIYRPLNQKLKNPKKLEHVGILFNINFIKKINYIIIKNLKNKNFIVEKFYYHLSKVNFTLSILQKLFKKSYIDFELFIKKIIFE